ncbi:MAG: SDR family oxidoreductase [Spirochaetia bacterium]
MRQASGDRNRAHVTGRTGRALVTGASRGIGKAIAEALVKDGWEVVGTCRNHRRLAVKDMAAGVRYFSLDLGNEAGIDALVKAVGDVDLLVNNAGESPIGPAEEIPIRKMRNHFQVNFFGPVRLTQGVLPGMRKRRRGMVLFIGSIRSEAPSPFSSIYSASKSAIRSFAECLRLELTGTGVRVSVAAPWYIRTGLPQEMLAGEKSPYAEAMKAVKEERNRRIARAPDPSTVARAVLRLVNRRDPPPFTVIGKPLLTFFVRHAPRALVAGVSARWTGMQPLRA